MATMASSGESTGGATRAPSSSTTSGRHDKFELDGEFLKEVSGWFRESDSRVVAAFSVQKPKQNISKKDRSRVLCLTIKRRKKSGNFHCKIVCIKCAPNEEPQVRDSYKLKTLISLLCTESRRGSPTFPLTLNFVGFSSDAYLFLSQGERLAWVGCLLHWSQETCTKVPICTGLDSRTAVKFWKDSVGGTSAASKEPPPAEAEERVGAALPLAEKDGALAFTESEESELAGLISESGFGLGDLDRFESFVQVELARMDASNMHAIMTSTAGIEGVIRRLDQSLGHVDDLEEWLNVFNAKLQHMRLDISAIEERNNALEVQSLNNSALLQSLQKLEESLSLDKRDANVMAVGGLATEEELSSAVAATWALHRVLCRVGECEREDSASVAADDPLWIPDGLRGIAAVRERKHELKRKKNLWVSRATMFFSNMFADRARTTLAELARSKGVSGAARAHEALADTRALCAAYSPLIEALSALDSQVGDALCQSYAQAFNPVLKWRTRELFSESRGLLLELRKGASLPKTKSSLAGMFNAQHAKRAQARRDSFESAAGSKVDEVPLAFSVILQQMVPFLCQQCLFCTEIFSKGDAFASSSPGAARSSPLMRRGSVPTGMTVSMRILLDGIFDDLFNFVKSALAIDKGLSIPLLNLCSLWLTHSNKRKEHYRVSYALEECQSLLRQAFSDGLGEILGATEAPVLQRTLKGTTVKNLRILPFFDRFARILRHFEYLSVEADSLVGRAVATCEGLEAGLQEPPSKELLEGAYRSLAGAMFAELERTAGAEVKPCHAERLRIENLHHFLGTIQGHHSLYKSLTEYHDLAQRLVAKSKRRYLEDLLEWSFFSSLFDFSDRLSMLVEHVPSEDVGFHCGFTPPEVSHILSKAGSESDGVTVPVNAAKHRVQKHFGQGTPLFREMWEYAASEMIMKLRKLEAQLANCYGRLMTHKSLDHLLNTLQSAIVAV